MRAALVSLVLVVIACGRAPVSKGGAGESTSDDAARTADAACAPDPAFPTTFEVPEASAATEVQLRPGVRELLVVSDSGEHGAALAYALPEGPPRRVRLPLDQGVSDDIEGVAWREGHVY